MFGEVMIAYPKVDNISFIKQPPMKMNSEPQVIKIIMALCGVLLLPLSAYSEEGQSLNKNVGAFYSYVPIVFYQNGFYPVVGVQKKKPLISVRERLISVEEDAKVFFSVSNTGVSPSIKTARFAHIRDVISHGGRRLMRIENSGNDEESINAKVTFPEWEEVSPISGPLSNAYGVFVFYNEKGVVELHWRNLKDTPEGEKLSVKIPNLRKKMSQREYLSLRKSLSYLFLVFQDGKELVPANDPQREILLNWIESVSTAQDPTS